MQHSRDCAGPGAALNERDAETTAESPKMASDYPITPAVRWLRAKQIPIEPCLYEYEEGGGTARSSAQLGVEEHAVVKTLVVRDDAKRLMLVLMHGNMEVS